MPWPSLRMPPAPPWGPATDRSEDPLLKLSGTLSVLGEEGAGARVEHLLCANSLCGPSFLESSQLQAVKQTLFPLFY